MNSDLYALIALAARYWFVALIVILLFRGWRMTVADNRRAKLLREWMGQTGCVGELILSPGSRRRVSYPIPREGVMGSGRAADVRIRSRELMRAHAHFELREGGLLIRPLGKAELSVGGGFSGESVFLRDGDVLTIGRLQLMLVLFDAPVEEEETDEWFEVGPDAVSEDDSEDDSDEWFGERPVARRARTPEDEDGQYQRPAARHARIPEDEDEQYQRPTRRARIPEDEDGQYQRPAARHARTPEDEDGQYQRPVRRARIPEDEGGQYQRPARRVQSPDGARIRRARKVPVTLEGHFSEAPAPKRARKMPAEAEFPFEAASGGRARRGAAKPKGARVKKPAGGNSTNEDAIWRDL